MAASSADPSKSLSLTLKNILLTGIVGWIASLYTLWHSAKVHAGIEIGESFCNISEKINCDTVALSKYSSVLGLPVPVLGLVYWVIVILLAMRGLGQLREGGLGRRSARFIFIAAGVGVASSAIFAFISLTQIGAFCLVCASIYLLTLLNFFFAWKIHKFPATGLATDSFSAATISLFIAMIFTQYLFLPVANLAAHNGQAEESAEVPPELLDQAKTQYAKESSYEIPDQKSPSTGPREAPVTVVEFSDFQCPHCANNHKNMAPALESFAPKVRIVYKNFPLDPACNSGGPHHEACFAAYAARCVLNRNGLSAYQQMQHYLFTESNKFTKASVRDKATSLGLSAADFDACVDSTDTKEEIKDEIDLGKSLGIEGTPTIFVNGKLLKQAANTPILKAFIKDLLK